MYEKLTDMERTIVELKTFYSVLESVQKTYFSEAGTTADGIDALAYLSDCLKRNIEGCNEVFQALWNEWGKVKHLLEKEEARKTA